MTGRVLVAAAAALALTAPGIAQQATFSSRLEAVRVDASVTRDGRAVKGLTAADFEILDNGVPQDVQVVASEELPIDLVMALDLSGSVTGDRLQHLRKASEVALAGLRKSDRGALLTFNHRLDLHVPLTSDLAAIGRALQGRFEPGNTSMIDAAYAALAHADSGRGRSLAVVLSDGVDTSSWLTLESVIETARRVDAVLFGVSIGAPRRTPLEELAEASGGDLIRIESDKQLAQALTSVLERFRQRYLLSFVPQNVARAGWHKLEVRAKRRGLTVKARAGYFGS
jgi:Ca-activated chloride channel family protein